MTVTPFYEGDPVSYVGDGLDGIPAARGKIMAFASAEAAHVEWTEGPRLGGIDMVSIYDLEKTASEATLLAPLSAPRITTSAVRKVMSSEGEHGVLQYLAATGSLETWGGIGQDVLSFVESRLRVDPSMDLPYEQLNNDEVDRLINTAARTLLRDLFSGGEAA